MKEEGIFVFMFDFYVPWDSTLRGKKPFPHCKDTDLPQEPEPTTNPPREAWHSEFSYVGNKMFQQGENQRLFRMAATSVHKVKNRTRHFNWNSWKDRIECILKLSSIL